MKKANRDREHFVQWLEQIYATADSELSCERFQALMPALVDFEVAGHDAAGQLAEAGTHLDQCPDCAAEYHGLLAVARLETEDCLPTVDESLARFPVTSEPEHVQEEARTPAP